jgi:putative transposase
MRLLQPLFALFATSTDYDLVRMVEFLKEENRILRSRLPRCITVTREERSRLLRVGARLGAAIRDLITIVTPRTFARWQAATTGFPARTAARRPGRPRVLEDIRTVVIRLARETGWGYTRILGELRKLGYRSVCRSTVVNILREAGLEPGPRRGWGSWDDFVQRHAATLWACDFFSVRMATLTGFVEVYVLAFLHVGSRRAFFSGFTANPTAEWVKQQARNASMQMAEWGLPASHLLIDHDTKFSAGFDTVFEAEGTEVKRVGPRAPNLNAHVERFIQSVRVECLDHFLICGEKHLRHILTEYLHYYNELRPHQGMGNVPLPKATDSEKPRRLPPDRGEVLCHERLGGLLRHYYRAAA